MIKSIEFKNLGPIAEASFELNRLTIICGKNGVGKTYLSYAYYLLTHMFFQIFNDSIKIPKIQSDDIDNNEIVKSTLTLNIYEIDLEINKVISKLKEFSTAVEIANELELNIHKPPLIKCAVVDDFFEKIAGFGGEIRYSAGSFSGKMYKQLGDTEIKIDIEAKDGFLKGKVDYSLIEYFIKHFISSICLKHGLFAITSERTGISMFYNDLNRSLREKVFIEEDRKIVSTIKYVKPIQENISVMSTLTMRNYLEIDGAPQESSDLSKVIDIMNSLVGGKYEKDKKSRSIVFKPNNGSGISVSLKSSSGSAKSLLLLDYFVRDLIDRTSVLVIDEPELNLHLDNQKKIAHLIAALVNYGVNVVVTTHSDHFIREINNLIMLSNSKLDSTVRADLLSKANIDAFSILNPDHVTSVVIDSDTGKTNKMKVTDFGIDLELFNNEIINSNDITNEIAHALYDCE
jgi:hypothetical protein